MLVIISLISFINTILETVQLLEKLRSSKALS